MVIKISLVSIHHLMLRKIFFVMIFKIYSLQLSNITMLIASVTILYINWEELICNWMFTPFDHLSSPS